MKIEIVAASVGQTELGGEREGEHLGPEHLDAC